MPFSSRQATARARLSAAAVFLGVTLASSWLFGQESPAAQEPPVFEPDVLPIFMQHCLHCHGLEHHEAGLDLRTFALLSKGGKNGSILVKGDPLASKLFQKISERAMPPVGELPLTDEKIDTIRRWIEAQAPARDTGEPTDEERPWQPGDDDRDYWAFRPPVRPTLPAVAQSDRVRSGVDRFLLAKLEGKGLGFSPDAPPAALIRRAYLDLIGLPPAPDELARFVADPAPDAYERLLDRLLASPHFGERWGRHWLDAAAYADVYGRDNDFTIISLSEGKWRYRDYVIRSFNADKPFDKFLTEQLAGDELVDWRSAAAFTPETIELLVATGFLRATSDDTESPELNTADIRHQVLNGTLEMLGTNLLGLTVGCARCHSHKFDPISQQDYFSLQAIFTPAFNPQSWLIPTQRQLPDVSPAEKARIEAHNAEIQRQIDEANSQLAELRRPYEARLQESKLALLPEPIRADTQAAIQTAADKRSELQKYLADKLGPIVQVTPDEVSAALIEADRQRQADLQKQLADLPGKKRSWGVIQAVYDVGPPSATYLLRRGDFLNPGMETQPRFLSVLSTSESPSDSVEPPTSGATSGRRLAFARWLTRPGTPAAGLVARVQANRIWQQLFGRGIVETSENFGLSGIPPTKPELLDWLAVEWIESGGRAKPLIKELMLSSAYRQSAVPTAQPGAPDPQQVDPDNELLWHMPLRRLESEVIRDCVLAASGKLDRTFAGPAIPQDTKSDGTIVVKSDALPTPTSGWRRSVYMLARRNYHLSMLAVFDSPALNTNCTRRDHSAVVLQSLAMMNDAFVMEHAANLADRVARDCPTSNALSRVERAFQLVLTRTPTPDEATQSAQLLMDQAAAFRAQNMAEPLAEQQALVQLCHVLLGTNEFLYAN